MPLANINSELRIESDFNHLQNANAIKKALGEIYSRKNLGLNVRTFTSTITLDTTDAVCLCDATNGAFTINLLPANNWSSRDVSKSPSLVLIHVGGTADITIDASGSETINGDTTYILGAGSIVELISDGASKWYTEQAVLSVTDLTPAGNVSVPAGFGVVVPETYTLALGKTLTLGLGAIFRIL